MAEPNYMLNIVGVFGFPVAENPTGVMQNAAFQALGLNWLYLNFEVEAEHLGNAVLGMRAMNNFRGVNLTIPHKVAVLQYLDEIAPSAQVIGAVNTVRREGDRLIGENTDGKGFMRALGDDADIDAAGTHAVVLGAGGAARAIAVELALAGARHITIVNRSRERGETLVRLLAEKTPAQAAFVPWQGTYRVPEGTDLLINATSIGLFPSVEDAPDIDYDSITPGMIVCDVIPNPPNTPFLRRAAERGAITLDGLGMLVYQGAIAFKMWTGQEPSVEVMRRALAAEFGG
ncbi:shikimate dehydrogenase [Caldilinea sp.]|jgi:shikimate dehydrogenase|uniref:shikimate dehydrogenase n=1 Tax=Caldilinea sp. TaxID=2293560 RepID=UPI001B22DEFE|nr:shikimate dehydrogenase [Caldilinea sp.]MBO9394698.1 shikimate dehydrogenase [Caldilinea sp.]